MLDFATFAGGVEPCLIGGGIVDGRAGTGGVEELLGGGGPAPLAAREGGPLGGGGVAETAGGLAPSFLFTHLFSSLSK